MEKRDQGRAGGYTKGTKGRGGSRRGSEKKYLKGGVK